MSSTMWRPSLLLLAAMLAAALYGAAAAAGAVSPPAGVLLSRYQPVAVLHPDEPFQAVAVDSFLATAALEQHLPDGSWTASAEQPSAGLPTSDPSGCSGTAADECWRLNIEACTPAAGVNAVGCYQRSSATRQEPNVVYGAVLRRSAGIVLEYWYWYWYDIWSGTFPPTDYVWQGHEGDWEVVAISLTPAGRPVSVGYSQHSCGKVRTWAKVPKWHHTTHPVVYVAFGTHANYFSPRPAQIDLRTQCYPAVGAAILRHYLAHVVDYTGRGRAFGPSLPGVAQERIIRLTGRSPQWMRFPGYWGEVNLFHAPDPIGTRVAGPAPRGPAFHGIWTHPLDTLRAWPRG
jgi:hypothetical protein